MVTGVLSEIKATVAVLKEKESSLTELFLTRNIPAFTRGAPDSRTENDPYATSTCESLDIETQLVEVRAQLVIQEKVKALLSQVLGFQPPISRLPAEILSDIFAECVSMDDVLWDTHSWFDESTRADRGMIPSALTVSHVSQYWREVAHSSARLWASLKIGPTQSAQYLDMFLNRAGESPLDIRIRGGRNWEQIKGKILPLVHRWRLFSGSSFSAFDVDKMVVVLRTLSAPLLEDLRLLSFDRVMRIIRGPDAIPILEGGAPKLSAVYLLDIGLQSCYPPLGALKTLDLHMFRPGSPWELDEMRDVLTASPSLTHLNLASAVLGSVNGRLDLDPIPVPSLRSIELSFSITCCPDRLVCIFVALAAPKLETLVINQAPSPNIERFIDAAVGLRTPKDYPLLNTLMFWDVDCGEWIRPAFMRVMPAVRSLTIVRSAEDAILNMLFEHDANPETCLWPELRSIKLSIFDVDLLCQVVTRRRETGRPIEALTIVHDIDAPKIPDVTMEWLRRHLEVHEIESIVLECLD